MSKFWNSIINNLLHLRVLIYTKIESWATKKLDEIWAKQYLIITDSFTGNRDKHNEYIRKLAINFATAQSDKEEELRVLANEENRIKQIE